MPDRYFITARELLDELAADDEYQEKIRRQDEEFAAREAKWREAERPFIRAIERVGLSIDSAWDLVDVSYPYPDAVPILLEHVVRPYPDRVLEGMARALGVPEARFAWDELYALYREKAARTDVKDGLAVALAAIADDDVIG